jgi:hypothetical protein
MGQAEQVLLDRQEERAALEQLLAPFLRRLHCLAPPRREAPRRDPAPQRGAEVTASAYLGHRCVGLPMPEPYPAS